MKPVMNKNKPQRIVAALLGVLILVLGGSGGFLLGRATAPVEDASSTTDADADAITKEQVLQWNTLYGTIQEKDGNFFQIQGSSENDVNGQGEFTFSITEDTVLLWNQTEITASELSEGNQIAVTYDGNIAESYPAQIETVWKVQLLQKETP